MAETSPLVTIGIPTRNRAGGYLPEAISAALRQRYSNLEIIVSDNCSSDNTREVVAGFRDHRIRYFRQPVDIGMNGNFNFCLNQARGEYFCLLPDDDLIDEDFVVVCMEGVRKSPGVGIVRTGTRIIDGKGNILKEVPNRSKGSSMEELLLDWFSGITSPYMCSSLLNRNRLMEAGGYDPRLNLWQDVGAEFKVAARAGESDIPDIKASFRKHANEITFGSDVRSWCDDSFALLGLLTELVPGKEELIREKGLPFLAYINYNRAMAIRSFVRRMFAFFIVYRKFGYKYKPSKIHFTD